jgi:hypothetical protein
VPGLTRTLIVNHGQGRQGAYDAALLDVAQDHLLYALAVSGVFEGRDLVLKGGTSLRKCLKVWGDVVDDGRGGRPLGPADMLRLRRPAELVADSIGVLAHPVRLAEWEERVRRRFGFLAELDEEEQRWAACDERHRAEVRAGVQALR